MLSKGRCGHSRKFMYGFTLIEMLIVIAIISILAGMLSPLLAKASQMAKQASCGNNLRQIYFILICYSDDNKNFLPPGSYLNAANNDVLEWGDALVGSGNLSKQAIGYNPSDKILLCPSSDVTVSNKSVYTNGNYGLNALITYTYMVTAASTFYRITKIKTPKSKIMNFDSGNCFIYYKNITLPQLNVWYFPGAAKNMLLEWDQGAYKNQGNDALFGRHSGQLNIVYVDGHAGSSCADDITEKALWERE